MRILVLLAIGLLLYIIISNLIRNSRRERLNAVDSERMVRCEHCGLHIVEKEALRDERHYFCSPAHLEAHRHSR